MVNANNYLAWIDGVQVPNQVSLDFTIDNQLIEVTTKPTNGFREFITGIKEGAANIECYLSRDELNRYEVGSSISLRVGTLSESFVSSGIISNIARLGGVDEVARYSIAITVNGEIAPFVPVFEDGLLLLESGDFFLLEDGENLIINTQTN